MKIYYIINGRLPTEKANGYQVSQMCQAFEENGVPVELIRPKKELLKDHVKYKHDLKNFYGLRRELNVKDVFSIDFQSIAQKINGRFAHFQYILNILHSLSFVLGLGLYLRNKSKDDVLYLRDVNILAWLSPLLKNYLKKNIILELHYFPEKLSKKKRYVRILKNAKKIICITHKMKSDLVSLGINPEKILVEHDGVDLQTFGEPTTIEKARDQLNYPQEDFIVGYVGNFHTNGREKGIDDLIRSAKYIFPEFPKTKFYFVGGPLDRIGYYQKIISENNLPSENFHFFDRRPISLVPISMQACNILTIPLPWNEHFAFYMSPMKLFEYMASGRPIVATDIESLREVLIDQENSLLAKHSNPEDFAKKLLIAMKDSELRVRISKNALVQVQSYSWPIRAKNILNFIA